jgi:hypothetical protein
LWLIGWHFGIDLVNLDGYGRAKFLRVLMAFVGWFAFLMLILVAFVGYGRLVINGGILMCCVDQSNVEILGNSVVDRLDVLITF